MTTASPTTLIRPVSAGDDLQRLTHLIHTAYAPHAARGLRYWGTHQSVEDTAKRFASGTGLVMLEGDEYVGTITLRPPQPASPVALYREPGVWTFCQFCISPDAKGRGTAASCMHMPLRLHGRRAPRSWVWIPPSPRPR